ncbi:hypothetical protein LguiB_010360 [Lonicera macranthoides]
MKRTCQQERERARVASDSCPRQRGKRWIPDQFNSFPPPPSFTTTTSTSTTMSLNMKTFTQALAKTAAVIEKTVQTTVQEVTGPKPLQDYELLHQIGSAGPALSWKLFSAKPRVPSNHQYPTVCVWLLDKRSLSESRTRAGLSKAAEDSFLEIIRADAAKLVRLRHPGVVHVVQGLDENKNAMAMVTEPLFASLANALGNVDNINNVPKELQGMEMGLLEVKHGLLQIAESLDFVHNTAHLIHRALSPETVLITSNGAWKLCGFGFAVSADPSSTDLPNAQAFHYAEYDVEDSMLPLQPSLNYTAPELVRSKASSAGCYSDIFSYGCLAYHLIARKPLLDCHNNVKMYTNNLTYLSSEAFSSIPSELVPDLQRMLSANEASRPTALDFTGSRFFRDDTRLRALRFLDHMLERDNMQKSEFLKALSEMWKDFDSRVLRYKVLPPLCAELRNMVMQPMILPMVMTIAKSQDKNDFELSTLPALVPVLSTAAGETLLLLVKNAELIMNKASQDHLVSHILLMLVRAYDDNDVRIQEEVLKKTVSLSKQLNVQVVKQAILPRVHRMALRTTVAAVRVNALLCLGDMVQILDQPAALEILQTIHRCTAVDLSAPTLMCTLGVANSMLKQHGVDFAAEHVLPLLTPLLVAQQLNVQQFAKYMLFIKDILRKIEEKRGVTLTNSGISEVKPPPAVEVRQPEPIKKTTTPPYSTAKTGHAWDEDWVPPNPKGSTTTNQQSSFQPVISNQPIQAPSASPQSTVPSAVDIEWPPRSSPSIVPQIGDDKDKENQNGLVPDSSFNDLDPFANWPPRHTSSLGAPGSSIASSSNKIGSGLNSSTPNSLNSLANNNASWTQNSNQGNSTLNIASLDSLLLNPQSSIGSLKNSQSRSAQKAMDLGSVFGSSKSEQGAPRLAPPPVNAVGRGRGRGRGNQGQPRSSRSKSVSDQPPLLDLL